MTHVTSIRLVMLGHHSPVLTEELTDGSGLVVSEKNCTEKKFHAMSRSNTHAVHLD